MVHGLHNMFEGPQRSKTCMLFYPDSGALIPCHSMSPRFVKSLLTAAGAEEPGFLVFMVLQICFWLKQHLEDHFQVLIDLDDLALNVNDVFSSKIALAEQKTAGAWLLIWGNKHVFFSLNSNTCFYLGYCNQQWEIRADAVDVGRAVETLSLVTCWSQWNQLHP